MSIQRFDLVSHTENYEDAEMIGFPDGDYVLFTDHAAEVERLNAERDALTAEDQRREMYLIATLNCAERAEKERDAAVARAERAEEALRELLDRIGEGIGHKFESWEMAAFLRELRPEIRAAMSPEPWGGPEGEGE